uniref:Formamidopyrimidine-DNA glycosylase H2TH DNA-binding domain-containing protein n=1 Tax=viral metagenome TaxID=1070528 RepID=A0A6C0KTR4_9ZZZZ
MPEGIEVFILAKVLKDIGYVCHSLGKHLILTHPYTGELYNYTFGLAGRVKINEGSLELIKINHPRIVSGEMTKINNVKEVEEKLGIDWMFATREQLEIVIRSWLGRKKQIGALLIDQKEICGIGVTWASEILHISKIHPTLKTNLLQFLDLINGLLDAIISTREKYVKIYYRIITKDRKKFVNSWFHNLYEERKNYLKVYGKGEILRVSGRNFYIDKPIDKPKNDSLGSTKQSPT